MLRKWWLSSAHDSILEQHLERFAKQPLKQGYQSSLQNKKPDTRSGFCHLSLG